MTKILILDNYDSFTFNLVHQVKSLSKGKVTVCRNDEIPVDEVEEFDHILLSPGPGLPKEAGIMPELILRYANSKNILGVCLGHQAIAEAFGATLINTDIFHGVSTKIRFDSSEPLFSGMQDMFEAGRYHSWTVSEKDFPANLAITARDEKGNIMGLSHRTFAIKGVQFHPESIMTVDGKIILRNWLNFSSSPIG